MKMPGVSHQNAQPKGITMLDQQAMERRENFRASVVPTEIKGLLTTLDQKDHQPFLIWDVSEHGLGLWVGTKINQGEEIRVTIAHPFLLVLDCEVRWCKNRTDAPGFHVGLKVLENYKRLRGLIDYVARSIEEAEQNESVPE